MVLSDVNRNALASISSGVIDEIGEENIGETLEAAVAMF